MAHRWRKSSHSGSNGDCVEVAAEPAEAIVRDSKEPDGAWLRIPAARWRGFLNSVVRGRFGG
ncbi:DUF397 domain-containing protein [Saccharopolyspora gregorii]|uniref:DUF397 domain-containing protein n=1 Tax=Saccharopolyspora gregorii TaxID=33914 RepID=A0ABP6RPC2_9PSEU